MNRGASRELADYRILRGSVVSSPTKSGSGTEALWDFFILFCMLNTSY